METNTPAIQSTSLFRPIPTNRLQSNLASHYNRTSEFVDARFNELIDLPDDLDSKMAKKNAEIQEDTARLKPFGLGRLLDIYA
ncbi:MAG: hypothetical protein AB1656_03530 [Candidatus Omnitrophota bacterium]